MQQIVAEKLFLPRFQLDGQIYMTGWPFRSTGWPIGHPVNMLGEALIQHSAWMFSSLDLTYPSL